MNDLRQLLLTQLADNETFIAVKHRSWPDGVHPPSAKMVSAQHVSRGLIAKSESAHALINVLQKPALTAVIDLKLFFPKRPLFTETDFTLLENFYETFDEAAALKRWGGCWIHVHDGYKTYIILPKGSSLIRTFFSKVVKMNNVLLEKKESDFLFQKLYSLPDSQCFLLAWFENQMRYRVENADLHKYEKWDELISW